MPYISRVLKHSPWKARALKDAGLLQVRSDRKQNIQVFSRKNLWPPWENELVKDQRYTPLEAISAPGQ